MPQVGSSSLLGRNQAVKLSGNQISKHYASLYAIHYETNQPNINTLDLNDSKQAYQDVKNGTTKVVGAEFMPTYLMNTMKTSEFSAGQTYGRSQIQDAFSFRDY